MVVFAGIAVLCLGALIVRYLRERKYQPGECPQLAIGSGEPGPDTLKITVDYCQPVNNVGASASKIGQDVMDALHKAFVNNPVSLY